MSYEDLLISFLANAQLQIVPEPIHVVFYLTNIIIKPAGTGAEKDWKSCVKLQKQVTVAWVWNEHSQG